MSRVVCHPSREAVDVRHVMPEYRWSRPLPGQPAGRAEPKPSRELAQGRSEGPALVSDDDLPGPLGRIILKRDGTVEVYIDRRAERGPTVCTDTRS